MKKSMLYLIFLIVYMQSYAEELKLMTFNFQASKAVSWFPDWYFWPSTPEKMKKHELAVELIEHYKPCVIGFQETHQYDMNKFAHKLCDYDWLGDPIQGKDKGDINAIMYQKDRFEVLQHGTFWLNENEKKYKLGWDAQHIRACTWAQFVDCMSGEKFWVFNTHLGLTHQSRLKSSELIRAKAEAIVQNGEFIVIMGDLNTNRLDSLDFPGWINTYAIAKVKTGPETTFPGTNAIIDYILINQNEPVEHAEIITHHEDDTYPSDHYPLMVTLQK